MGKILMDKKNCSHCNTPGAEKTCSVCKSAVYCSVDCQRKHWKVHKPHCKRPVDKEKPEEFNLSIED